MTEQTEITVVYTLRLWLSWQSTLSSQTLLQDGHLDTLRRTLSEGHKGVFLTGRWLYYKVLPTYLPSYLPTYLPSYLPSYLPHLPTYLPTHLPTDLPSHLPSYPLSYRSICLPSYLPTYLPTYLFTYPPTYLPTFLHTDFICSQNAVNDVQQLQKTTSEFYSLSVTVISLKFNILFLSTDWFLIHKLRFATGRCRSSCGWHCRTGTSRTFHTFVETQKKFSHANWLSAYTICFWNSAAS